MEDFKRAASAALLVSVCALLGLVANPAFATDNQVPGPARFQRIATFPVFLNTGVDVQTVAEIITASDDGNLLVYTDSAGENIGFIDITDPKNPQPGGTFALNGEPTSVAIAGRYALAAVNTSESFTNPSGELSVVDIREKRAVRTFDLGGQPDSIAISPDKRFAVIAIENERDEELGDGRPEQAPPGFVVIIDLHGDVDHWGLRTVALVGIPDLFPNDPEPEFVDINRHNIAAVTLQENNHIVLIELHSGRVLRDFSAGIANVDGVDTKENGLIEPIDSISVPREPDAVSWIGTRFLTTADEGDLDGGSRGFTIYDRWGNVRVAAGNRLELEAIEVGHYPEGRSESKGNETEGVEFATFGRRHFFFYGSERASVVYVFRLKNGSLRFVQTLPSGVGPEGLLAIPKRNLFVVAAEEDAREDKLRSAVSIYKLSTGYPSYPTISSARRADGSRIAWGALSGLAADPDDASVAYTIHDNAYIDTRIYRIDVVNERYARIREDIVLRDENGDAVNIDAEGLAVGANDDFWIAAEGAGSVDDEEAPVTARNTLLNVLSNGDIIESVALPDATNALQKSDGFAGVTSVIDDGRELVYVAFKRGWVDDPENVARIGRYDTASGEWTFFYYPLDAARSPNGGAVTLSGITALDEKRFAVIERDDQGGTDARIKMIYQISVDNKIAQPEGAPFETLTKRAAIDLLPILEREKGAVLEKVDGLAILANGRAVIVTDNDGVEDTNGETQFLSVGNVSR